MDTTTDTDASWDKALELVQRELSPTPALTRLIHASWNGGVSSREFINALAVTGVSPSRLIRAARIYEDPAQDLEGALTQLGLKTAAIVLAIQATSAAIITNRQSDRAWAPILRELMNCVEIGYHFGVCNEHIGPDYGMMIGFAQYVGTALLLSAHDSLRVDSTLCREALRFSERFSHEFHCESYQVCSLALQRLGFGPELAATAAVANGRLNHDAVSSDPLTKNWSAASDWIVALHLGEKAPLRRTSQERFRDLMPPSHDRPLPTHLDILYTQINDIIENGSTWCWHLTANSYAETLNLVGDSQMTSLLA